MSILFGPLPPPPTIGELLGEFDVVPDVLVGSTPGEVIGGLGIGTLVRVAVLIGVGLFTAGKVLSAEVIHWWYCALRSLGMEVESLLPQIYIYSQK